MGFLPNRTGKRKKALKELVSEPHTLVFYEAPHRLHGMLADLLETLGDRPAVLMRELTKIYEEVLPGRVGGLLEALKGRRVRGEITLVVAGADRGGGKEKKAVDDALCHRLEILLRGKTSGVRDIARKVADEEGVPFRTVYRQCISIIKKREGP
jgi:16S rRNA (cytidine1402-2'-O)-methyltransferase